MEVGAQRLKHILNILVLLLSIYSISKRNYVLGEPSAFEKLVISLFSPIQNTIVSTKSKFSGFIDHYFLLVNADKENEELKKRINELNTIIFSKEELDRENERLKELLQFSSGITYKKVLAQVVGWDSSSHFKVLRINKGTKHGIQRLSTVITNNGLVGYVYRSTKRYSDILTIFDQNNRVDGIVARTRSHGIIEGFGDKCIMKYVTRTEPVVLNDYVITSGLGRIYPKGLKIGRITKIERESYGITQYIEVTPSAEFGKIEEVVVLTPQDGVEVRKELKELDDKKNKEFR